MCENDVAARLPASAASLLYSMFSFGCASFRHYWRRHFTRARILCQWHFAFRISRNFDSDIFERNGIHICILLLNANVFTNGPKRSREPVNNIRTHVRQGARQTQKLHRTIVCFALFGFDSIHICFCSRCFFRFHLWFSFSRWKRAHAYHRRHCRIIKPTTTTSTTTHLLYKNVVRCAECGAYSLFLSCMRTDRLSLGKLGCGDYRCVVEELFVVRRYTHALTLTW